MIDTDFALKLFNDNKEKAKDEGLSTRQLARSTGISRSIILKA